MKNELNKYNNQTVENAAKSRQQREEIKKNSIG